MLEVQSYQRIPRKFRGPLFAISVLQGWCVCNARESRYLCTLASGAFSRLRPENVLFPTARLKESWDRISWQSHHNEHHEWPIQQTLLKYTGE